MTAVTTGAGARIRMHAGPWTVDDAVDEQAVAAFRKWAADPLLSESLNRVPEEISREDALANIRRHDRRTAWIFFVRDPARSATVAYVSMSVDRTNGVASMELIVGDPASRSPALMDHVAVAVGRWMFERQRMRKVVFHIRADNLVTARWLRRNAVLEGRLRGDIVLPDGRIVDRLLYGMMPDEWAVMRDRVEAGDVPAVRERRDHRPGARIGLRTVPA
jgi:RimJ/RimL family protein N-acetyltransferase